MKALVGVVALLALAGCTAAPTSSGPIDSEVSAEQLAAVEDDEVTQDEYEAGFQRFRACMSAEGYEVIVSGEFNDTLNYAIPDAAVQSGVDEVCYTREFRLIDMAWQVAREDTSYSAQVLRDCLTENGITPEDTLKEMAQQAAEAGITC